MHYDAFFPPRSDAPFRVALVGCGEFGACLARQMRHIDSLKLLALCDRNVARGLSISEEAGYSENARMHCDGKASVAAAMAQGRVALIEDVGQLHAGPIDIVVEATGDPGIAAKVASAAIEHGCHVAMATKEADSVIGPLLAQRAAAAGLVYTPVDGDQPSLLMGLISWTRQLGFDIVAAGKSSEYDFILDTDAHTVTSAGRCTVLGTKDFPWTLAKTPRQSTTVIQRRELLPDLLVSTVPDLCEMGLVANATGLGIDCANLHSPIARTVELPYLFRPREEGGLLGRCGVIDTFNCLRRPDELSFAGGVFVVVKTGHVANGKILGAKGIPVSEDHRYALFHNPVHLLGMEAPISILSACQLGHSSAGSGVHPHYDLTARVHRAFRSGEKLMLGERHSIDGLTPQLSPARPLGNGAPVPYYLIAGARLKTDVAAGTVLESGHLEFSSENPLWTMRKEQDRLFALANDD